MHAVGATVYRKLPRGRQEAYPRATAGCIAAACSAVTRQRSLACRAPPGRTRIAALGLQCPCVSAAASAMHWALRGAFDAWPA
jgi:hypothetical protein